MTSEETRALLESGLAREVLDLLTEHSEYSDKKIAELCGSEEARVREIRTALEEAGIILGYGAIVNWNATRTEAVTGLIEVRVTPQRNRGFDSIARRLYNFPEVSSCYLMSGDYDLLVIVNGDNLRDVARFVSEKISVIESVLSTRTHFILKVYKTNGHILAPAEEDGRETVVL